MQKLTAGQIKVVNLRAEGLTVKEIAYELGVTVSAVKQQLSLVYAKWNVRNVAQLIKAKEAYDREGRR